MFSDTVFQTEGKGKLYDTSIVQLFELVAPLVMNLRINM